MPPPTTAVTTIDLSHQHLTRSSLSLLPPSLTCVDLSRCGLDGVGPLRRLVRLELLNISYNRLLNLDDLRHSTALKVLYARSNKIADVGGASTLVHLQSLDLECNRLTSLDALTPLWSCGALTELRLRGNLVPYAGYKRECVTHLKQLKSLDGNSLTADPSDEPTAESEADDPGRSAQLMTEAVERWQRVSGSTPPREEGAPPAVQAETSALAASPHGVKRTPRW